MPPALSPVLGGGSPRASPTGGTIVVDEELITSLLENHQAEILSHIEDQDDRVKEAMNTELQIKWDNFRGTYKKTVRDEVKDAVASLLETLRGHVNKTIEDKLGATLRSIEGSAARGLDASQKEDMSRSFRDDLKTNNAELVQQLTKQQDEENSGVQKVRRVLTSRVRGVTARLDKQKASTGRLFTKLEGIATRHESVGRAIDQVLRPLREKINSLEEELPRLNRNLIDTQNMLRRIEGLGPALPLEGEAQVEVCRFTHFI
jgi:hypothetical protein